MPAETDLTNDFLSDDEWEDLLDAIHAQKVIPVIGPELVTVPDPTTGEEIPLHRALAPALAEKLGLSDPERFTSCNDVARRFLFDGGKRQRIYSRLAQLLDGLDAKPSPALQALARIGDFNLYVCSTPDPLMARALHAERPGFIPETNVLRFHPSDSRDIFSSSNELVLYHILGDYLTQPDFVVWEEDYIEFICGLLERAPVMPELFSCLQRKNLLLLGAPSQDWIVRFLLRVARRQRLSDKREEGIYLADRKEHLGDPMVFFFEGALKITKIVNGSPREFVLALEQRWRQRYGNDRRRQAFLQNLPQRPTRGSVFISYSRDDAEQVVPFALALHAAGVPVWLDNVRLQSGQNFELEIERAIKHDCALFISVISRATEADAGRFVHVERRWAAERQVEGVVFYIPLILDLPVGTNPQLESDRVSRIHRERLDASTLPSLTRRMKQLMDFARSSGRASA